MRFSSPSTKSRLRRPMSASTSTTCLPSVASAQPTFAVVVVLPTPPFPDVTTYDFPVNEGPFRFWSRFGRDDHDLAVAYFCDLRKRRARPAFVRRRRGRDAARAPHLRRLG